MGGSGAASTGPAVRVATKSHLNRKTVANHLTLLGSLLRLAVELEWMPRAPRVRKPKVRLISQDFAYLRTDDEIARFLRAAREEGEAVHALYATAIYTGARAGELAGLHWDAVNLERRLITIQRSFDGPTKADDVRYVPVVDALLPILRAWRLRHPGRLVFTNRDGEMLRPSGRVFQETLHDVLDAAGFDLPRRALRATQRDHHQQRRLQRVGSNLQGPDDHRGRDRPPGAPLGDPRNDRDQRPR